MDIDPHKYFVVITGDFIGFSSLDLSIRRQMPQVIVDGGKKLCGALGAIMPWDADVFRGDGWQVLITSPVLALRAALFLRAHIIASADDCNVDTRMAIGIGPVDYVPAGKIAAGDGAAYRVSGNLLEKMGSRRHERIRCAFAYNTAANKPPGIMVDEELTDALVRVTGALGDRWRSRQARAVTGALQGLSMAEIAKSWPGNISRQAIGRHLGRAGWRATAHALEIFEKKMECFSDKNG